MAFDNKFITKKSLKLHLNLSWFKLCTISPKKRQFILADTYSPWKDTFKPPSWKAIWDWVRVWKHFPWIFHLVDLFFYILVFHVIFIKIMAKKKSWLVLIIGFNNNSINTVAFSIYFPFYVIFIKKWQKTSDCNFQHRAPIMEGCWRTSASSCCKSWRGSCGHRS